jgi:hypothetical protein
MAKAKPKIELKPEPDDDVRLYGVFDLWAAGFIPVGESRLRKLIQDREWECGTLGTRYVCTGTQHYRNILRATGR